MYVFVSGIDKTNKIIRNSISISEEMQERQNSCSFECLESLNDMSDIRVFGGYPIGSATSSSIVLKHLKYNTNEHTREFRIGDKIYIAINETSEETVIISSLTNENGFLGINTTGTFKNVPTNDFKAGKLLFAGNITSSQDRNIGTNKNITYQISALDYGKIFDKELVNDTWENRDGRYIINSFCNDFINKNYAIDKFEYGDNAEMQAEWIQSLDGSVPTLETSDIREGEGCGKFSWTFSGGSATWQSTPGNLDILDFTGNATKGKLCFWLKTADYTKVTNISFKIGSDSSNYVLLNFLPNSNNWIWYDLDFANSIITGAPNFSSISVFDIIVTETASSYFLIDGVRIFENVFFRHYPYVKDTDIFTDFRVPRKKPTEVMQRIADELGWYWYVDYERYIRLFSNETNSAPFSLSETSNNYNGLSINYDTSQIINRIVVQGATETSLATYSQVVEGDGVVKEWIMKNKFKNLSIFLDDNTSVDTCEAGTTTTLINATAHGLKVGDYICNRTRSKSVRVVLTADINFFTVDTVAGQTSGDTFTKFTQEQTVGVEGLGVEADFDYMSNFNERSIRNSSENKEILQSGQFLAFYYNEVVPILVQRSDAASISAMQTTLGYSNGVFDGQPIIDQSIGTRSEAIAVAQAKLRKFSNTIFTANFRTGVHGLNTGQLINIKDTANGTRNINQNFLIQRVQITEIGWGEYEYGITASSLLFGMIELLEQLLKQGRKIEVDENAIINNITDSYETIFVGDVLTTDKEGEKTSEIIYVNDNFNFVVREAPFKWASSDNDLIWTFGTWA